MGTYIYGWSKEEKLLPVKNHPGQYMRVGRTYYLGKPSWSGRPQPIMDRKVSRCETMNEGRDYPKFYTANDQFEEWSEVYDQDTRVDCFTGNKVGRLPATHYDSGPVGDFVGVVLKEKGRWVIELISQEELIQRSPYHNKKNQLFS